MERRSRLEQVCIFSPKVYLWTTNIWIQTLKLKLSKESLNRLAERLPRIELSPVTNRIAAAVQPLTSRLAALGKLRLRWPIFALIALVALVGLAIRLLPLMPAVAMPGELARANLVGGQQVILWYALDDLANKTLMQMIDEFNAVNPWGITVVPQAHGSYSRLRERLNAALEHDAAPDLAMLYPYHVAAYAARGQVIPLDAYLDDPDVGLTRANLDDFIPGVLQGDRNPQFDNQLMSFPVGPNVIVLVYNLDWLRSLGYQSPPLTWGTFKEVCKQAVTDTNGDGAPDTFGYAFVANAPTFSALVLTRGGQVISADGRRALFNTLEGEKALRTLREVFNSRCAYIVSGHAWDRGDFVSAKTMFNIAPSSELPAYIAAIEQTSAFRWGTAPLPHTTTDPITPMYGQSWTIFKTAPSRQWAAWLFVRWFAETRQTQRWAQANYTLPLRRSAVEALSSQETLDPNFRRILELATSGRPEPSIAAWDRVGKILVDAMQSVAEGMEPKDALDQAEKETNAVLQRSAP